MARKISFRNQNSPLKYLSDQLEELIPLFGEVKGSKNRKLERLRKAINAYNDLFNNGLCNRAQSFARIFGMAGLQERTGYDWKYKYHHFTRDDFVRLGTKIEPIMERLVIEAALEQGLTVKPKHLKVLEY